MVLAALNTKTVSSKHFEGGTGDHDISAFNINSSETYIKYRLAGERRFGLLKRWQRQTGSASKR